MGGRGKGISRPMRHVIGTSQWLLRRSLAESRGSGSCLALIHSACACLRIGEFSGPFGECRQKAMFLDLLLFLVSSREKGKGRLFRLAINRRWDLAGMAGRRERVCAF